MNGSHTGGGDRPLSILHINTHDVAGGAAKVAWRLCKSQRAQGHDSRMLVGIKTSPEPHSEAFEPQPEPTLASICRNQGYLFYEFQGSHKLVHNPTVRQADILHFHNLHGNYFNPFSISVLSHFKPVVWTLHDMQAITGHCAHAFDCQRWKIGCGQCPTLQIEPALAQDTTAQLLKHKRLIYDHSHLNVVTPSHWLRQKVDHSILADHRLELIYNGIDTEVFKPHDSQHLRRELGIPQDLLLIGALAHSGTLSNVWKGGEFTQSAIETLWAKGHRFRFINIGDGQKATDDRILNIPHIKDESRLAQIISILDIFLYTPRADNCPLVVLETMACGIPIVSFGIGGIPELVRHRLDGLLVNYGDKEGLIQALEALIADRQARARLADSARRRALTRFDGHTIQRTYMDLYRSAIDRHEKFQGKVRLFSVPVLPSVVSTPEFLNSEVFKAGLNQKESKTPWKEDAKGLDRAVHPAIVTVDPPSQALARIRDRRRRLAPDCLKTPVDRLGDDYRCGIQNEIKKLLESDIKSYPLELEERQIADHIREILEKAEDPVPPINALLAAMLFFHPHQIPVVLEIERLPEWLQLDYWRFLVRQPQSFWQPGEVETYGRYFEKLVSHLHARYCPKPVSTLWAKLGGIFSGAALLIPLYFSRRNTRNLMVKRAQIVRTFLFLSRQLPEWLGPAPAAVRTGRIRLGVYLRSLKPYTEVFATLPVFKYLNRSRFEIFVYVQMTQNTPLERQVRNEVDRFVLLSPDMLKSLEMMRQDHLDILLIGNNTTAASNGAFMLANQRVAPIQAVHFCSPTTTGLPHIDYFLTGELMMPKTSSSDCFSETLIPLKGSGICFVMPPEEIAGIKPLRRSALGISQRHPVLVSGANFFKIIPELRHTWAEILVRVPDAVLMLYPFGPAWSSGYPKRAFVQQLEDVFRSAGISKRRLIVFDTMADRQEIFAILKTADIYLDAIPYSGATSLIDPLKIGLPTVVMAGEALRFRQGAAILEEMGLNELVALDETRYIDLAVKLATQDDKRLAIRRSIKERMKHRPPFLDPERYAATVSEAFESLMAARSHESGIPLRKSAAV